MDAEREEHIRQAQERVANVQRQFELRVANRKRAPGTCLVYIGQRPDDDSDPKKP
jgi:hypothetical protein